MMIIMPKVFSVIETTDQGQPVAMPVDSIATIIDKIPNGEHLRFMVGVRGLHQEFLKSGYRGKP
ncbi:hypothetical protein LOKG_00006 [Loktanella phage pCB2051-A]|uniref:Uncharacterized protein n=1 Tax=Loktanella phage pCB2051-A TaxID=754044 RepID=M4QRG1_9CAUD|nr:hypothetical protein LOKG_00006 [Loktanella phage pCB2051-A]AGH31443.1 hypothetical protein LOKG_00006 [Loktanella phage pCB2051-A]